MGRKDQSHRKQQKALKRQRKAQAQRKRQAKFASVFLEGIDSYVSAFDKLKRSAIVKSLKGIYELSDDAFYKLTLEQKLEHVGLNGHSIVYYNCEHDNEKDHHANSTAKGTGSTSAVLDPSGNIRPIIFLRDRIDVDESNEESDDGTKIEVAHAIQILVLLHELGHADDIAKGINFNHDERRLDLVAAEIYAHRFACTQAKKHNFRMALGYYLENIDEGLKSETEYVRLAAERFCAENDVSQLKDFASKVWHANRGREYYLAMKRAQRSETN